MAKKRTIINADEELIIQGSLIVEGEFVQKEFVETVSYTENKFLGDVLTVNADGFDLANNQTSATLKLTSGLSNSTIVYNGSDIAFSANIVAPNLNAGTLTGYLDGTAKNAEAFVNSVTVGMSGDASGSATFINAGDTATIPVVLATVNATSGTFGGANRTIDTITVNGKGLIREIADTPISITNSQVTDFVSGVRSNISVTDNGGDGSLSYDSASGVISYTGPSASEVRAHFSVTDTGGDGSLSYDSSTGVFTYTGPSASEVRAHFSGGTGVDITNGVVSIGQAVGTIDDVTFNSVTANVTGDVTGDVTGTVSSIANHDTDDLAEGTNLYFTTARARETISHTNVSGDGSIDYDSTTGVISYTGPSASEVRVHFSATNETDGFGNITYSNTTGVINFQGVTEAEIEGIFSAVDNGGDGSFTYANGVMTYTGPSASEVRAHFTGGDGIDLASGDIAVDSTVIRDSGDQTISGVKTFNGTVDLSSAIVPSFTVAGDLTVEGTLNTENVVDSYVQDTLIMLNANNTISDNTVSIEVNRPVAGSNTFIQWNESLDKWQFTNDGTTLYDLATTTVIRDGISVDDQGGDGSLSYNSTSGVITYTGPSPSEVRAHFSVTNPSGYGTLSYSSASGTFEFAGVSDAEIRDTIDVTNATGFGSLSYSNASGVITHTGVSSAEIRQQLNEDNLPGGDGLITYYPGNGIIQYQGPTQSDANSRIAGAPDQVRNHFSGGYAIDITNGVVSLDTVNDTITFSEGHVKLSEESIGIGFSAGSFTAGTSNSVAIGYEAGSTNQRSAAVSIGTNAGRLDQGEGSIAIGFEAGRSYQGANVVNSSSIAIGTYAGYLSQSEHAIAVGTGAGLFSQDKYSIAIGHEAGNIAQGAHSIAIGNHAGQSNQPANSIVIRAGDITTYPAVNGIEEGALYISPIRTLANKTGNVLMYDSSNSEVLSVPSVEFVSSSFDQSIAGVKTFTDELVIPDTATTRNGAIYFDASTDKAYIRINGSTQEITPAVSVGTVADIGASGINVYGGNISAGNTTTHYIKSIDAGTYTTISESANVITVDGDASAIRGLFSVSDTGGDGSLTYNNSTGTFTYTGPSASDVRAHFSAGTGITLVNGVISATGDNYESWSVQTDSGAGANATVSSSETLQIVGGTNITVTNVGKVITIRNDNASDITAVTAGSGLTGGGSAGDLTLNVGAGTGVTVGTNSISIGQDVSTTADVTFNSIDVVGNAIVEGDLTVNGNTFSINTTTLSVTDNMIYLNSNSSVSNPDLGFAGNYNDGTYAHAGFFRDTTDGYWKVFDSYTPEPDANAHIDTGHATFNLADIRASTFRGNIVVPGEYSLPTTDGTVNQVLATDGSGNVTFKDVSTIGGTITGVVAGSGLTGGGLLGTVTLDIGAGPGITVNADDIEVDMTAFDTTNLAEGTNLYYTTTRANSDFDTRLATKDTGDLAEGINRYFTDARARGAISVTDAGGDGSLSYDTGNGIITYTGPSPSEVRAHLSGGTGITYDSSTGVIALSDTGYVSGVTAGTGLTGGGASGNVTLNIGAGAGITVNADNVALTSGVVTAASKGSASKSASITVDTYGRVTSLSDQDIAIASSQVSGLATSATTDTTNADNISSGTLASARLPDLAVADFDGAAIQTSAEAFDDSDTVLMTAAAIEDRILSKGYSTVDTLKAVNQAGLITLQLDDASGFVDEVYLAPSNHITIDSGGAGIISFSTDATSANTGSTLVARDSSGNFAAGVVTATATSARYADLAEKYDADADYEPGTVVVFGGDKEITVTDKEDSPRVAGVISTDPAYMMNSEANGLYVALRGRVPCKVIGKVQKGDVLITSTTPGYAQVSSQPHFVGAACIVGKAISSKDTDGPGVVEILV